MKIDVSGSSTFLHTGGVDFDPSLPTVLLIHGAGQDHTLYRFVTRALAHRGLGVLAVDLPGHGQSGGRPAGSIEESADWIIRVLDAVGAHRAVLVGHSMGSFIALEAAVRAPARVAGLVLTGTADSMPVNPALLEAAQSQDHLAVDLIAGWTHTGRSVFGGHPQAGTWTRGGTERLLERELSSLSADLEACAEHDPTATAPAVQVPVVIVIGGADAMTRPRRAQQLAALLPDVEVQEFAGVGHDVVFERPDVIIRSVIDVGKRSLGRRAGDPMN